MENNNESIVLLEKRLDDLIKRFEEQRGIINSYVEKERDWKKTKLLQNKEIKNLNEEIQKAKLGD